MDPCAIGGRHSAAHAPAAVEQVVSHTVVRVGGDFVLGLDLMSFALLCDRVVENIEARAAQKL
jgi:hypothetical protein